MTAPVPLSPAARPVPAGRAGVGGAPRRTWRSALVRLAGVAGLLGAVIPATAAGVAATDDEGREIRLSAPARRIVSLGPHATEMLFAIGAGDRVVGAVEFSDFPPAALKVPRVGSAAAADVERIRGLAPDLVVAWASGNPARQTDALRRLGLPVFVSEPRTLPGIASAMQRLGELAGTAPAARAAADHLLERVRALEARYAGRAPVRMFYQVWDHPLMTVNGRHAIAHAMRTCGAVNVFETLPALVPTVDEESVVAANPELIAATDLSGQRLPWLEAWKRWPGMTAVARGNLVLLPPDLLVRMGPRMVEGSERLCEAVDAARRRRPAP